MKILHIRPEPPGGLGRTVARFDLALSEDVRMFGLRLVARAAGGHSVYAPNAHGTRVATFSGPIIDQITSTALAALKELAPRDRSEV